MEKSLYSQLPNPDDFLVLQPEELAGVVLAWLNSVPNLQLSRHNFGLFHTVNQYPQDYHKKLLRALMEAWAWLEREGFIAPEPGNEGWYFITRRGQRIKESSHLNDYRRANVLPKNFLHPLIAEKVYASFLRGDYDTAVFQAFKEVEVRVRDAGNFAANILGTDLMRKAFDPKAGPLTDQNVVTSERQALSDLFAGAIGSYKNPHSHRNVPLDTKEAAEMIILASHLLNIVDARAPSTP